MAYRQKGVLTKKQREAGETFIRTYSQAMKSKDIGTATRELLEAAFTPWVLIVNWILYVDNIVMINKIISKEV